MARAFANVPASSTDYTLVAAVDGQIIEVLGLFVMAGGTATQVTFNTKTGSAAGTAITPALQCGANGGAVLPVIGGEGWAATNSGAQLSVTTGSGSTVGIIVFYKMR